MRPALQSALADALGSPITSLRPVSGGDINDAYALTTASGEQLFVKTRADAPTGMFPCEAEGLCWLAEAEALPTPEIRLVREDCLVLRFVPRGPKRADFEALLGRGLAQLHRYGAPSFGLTHDNYIANLPQANAPLASFAEFYRERRLEPLVLRARREGLLTARDSAAFERLYARLTELIPEEPPARVHGDLWSGNVHVDASGAPMLIDPAVYGGQRELDLAMLQLFGAPSAVFFAAYDEVYPRAVGHDERVPLWQLYPLLVHVCLFGSAYVPQLRSALARYVFRT
ncbi:MAG: Fructosamine/Ketosamine-3-kinase [Myxococcaceae bacterium]|nr:Fructosamine/Ketosamine-3-kinase [Myxococcaceae bacterium]